VRPRYAQSKHTSKHHCKNKFGNDDSLEGKMAADPLKNKKMLNKFGNICIHRVACEIETSLAKENTAATRLH
jgi:hypothetical protein